MKELIERLKAKSIPQNRYHSSTDINLKDLQALLEYVEKLSSLQSKGKASAEQFLRDKYKLVDFHDLTLNGKPWLELMEEYAQSPANKDGWVSVPVGSWIEFDSKINAELFSIEARKNCLCKFDDGEVCRFNDDHPKAILTHFQITP